MADPYFQDETITRQYRLADILRNQPQARSGYGVLAQGLGAIGGNIVQGSANNALQSNQALRQQGIDAASNATDMPTLSKALIGSPVPELQDIGLKTKIQQISDDPNKVYRVRAAQAQQYGIQPGTAEFKSFVLTGKLLGEDGGAVFGKAGTIVQDRDGKFYSVQFGANGQKKVEPLQLGETSLAPSRGTDVVGDTLINKATGDVVRNVAPNLEAAERAKTMGRETAQGAVALPKAETALKQYEVQTDIVKKEIGRALEMAKGDTTTGLPGAITSKVPGTTGYNLAQTLNTIKANVGFDKLQAMRDASPTGGALGQVSEQENILLQSVLGALSQSQTKEQFVYNLNRLQETVEKFRELKREAYQRDVARFGAASVPNPETGAMPVAQEAAQPKSKEEYDALPSGTRYVDPAGNMRTKP